MLFHPRVRYRHCEYSAEGAVNLHFIRERCAQHVKLGIGLTRAFKLSFVMTVNMLLHLYSASRYTIGSAALRLVLLQMVFSQELT